MGTGDGLEYSPESWKGGKAWLEPEQEVPEAGRGWGEGTRAIGKDFRGLVKSSCKEIFVTKLGLVWRSIYHINLFSLLDSLKFHSFN